MKKNILIFTFISTFNILIQGQLPIVERLTSIREDNFIPDSYEPDLDNGLIAYLNQDEFVEVVEVDKNGGIPIHISSKSLCLSNQYASSFKLYNFKLYILIENDLIIEDVITKEIEVLNDIIDIDYECYAIGIESEKLIVFYSPSDYNYLVDINQRKIIKVFDKYKEAIYTVNDKILFYYVFNQNQRTLRKIDLLTLVDSEIVNNFSYSYFPPFVKNIIVSKYEIDLPYNFKNFIVDAEGKIDTMKFDKQINSIYQHNDSILYLTSYEIDTINWNSNHYLYEYNVKAKSTTNKYILPDQELASETYLTYIFKNKIYMFNSFGKYTFNLDSSKFTRLNDFSPEFIYKAINNRYVNIDFTNEYLYDLELDTAVKVNDINNYYSPLYFVKNNEIIIIDPYDFQIRSFENSMISTHGKLLENKKRGMQGSSIFKSDNFLYNISKNKINVYDVNESDGIRTLVYDTLDQHIISSISSFFKVKNDILYFWNLVEKDNINNKNKYSLFSVNLDNFEKKDILKERNLPYSHTQYPEVFIFGDWIFADNNFYSTLNNEVLQVNTNGEFNINNPKQIGDFLYVFYKKGPLFRIYRSHLATPNEFIIFKNSEQYYSLVDDLLIYRANTNCNIIIGNKDYIIQNGKSISLNSRVINNINNEFLFLNKDGAYFEVVIDTSSGNAFVKNTGQLPISDLGNSNDVVALKDYYLVISDNQSLFITIKKSTKEVNYKRFDGHKSILQVDSTYIYIYNDENGRIEKYDSDLNMINYSEDYNLYNHYAHNFMNDIEEGNYHGYVSQLNLRLTSYFKQGTFRPLIFEKEKLKLHEIFSCQSFEGSGLRATPFLIKDNFYYFNFHNEEYGSQFYKLDLPLISQVNEDVTNNCLTVFPNPGTDYLQIKSDLNFENIWICDVSGKLVLNKIVNNKIDVSELPTGFYSFKVSIDDKFYFGKFIVQ